MEVCDVILYVDEKEIFERERCEGVSCPQYESRWILFSETRQTQKSKSLSGTMPRSRPINS
jgi:hypothetical protein